MTSQEKEMMVRTLVAWEASLSLRCSLHVLLRSSDRTRQKLEMAAFVDVCCLLTFVQLKLSWSVRDEPLRGGLLLKGTVHAL